MDEEVEKDVPPIVVEEDPLSIISPNIPLMRPCIEVRILRCIKEELERGFVKCLPPLDADTFMVSLPLMVNDEFDSCTLDWCNVDFIKSRCEELNGLLEKQVF